MMYWGSGVRAAAHPSLPKNWIDGTRLVLLDEDVVGTGAAAAGTGAAATVSVGAAAAGSAAAVPSTVASASVSISYKSAPTSTSSSMAPNCWVMTPAFEALISTVTLSVSISATTSSSSTRCPTCANHSTIVPSVMESPMVGTLVMCFSRTICVAETNPRFAVKFVRAAVRAIRATAALPLDRIIVDLLCSESRFSKRGN
mmetsp:Transcript_8933/g.18557  ORF Transcript_8933/g.18557 Transcript_8933/m.18557 type:complete len:200 (+) Transcript_8933:324-923(+)